jgi:hypothetical protein
MESDRPPLSDAAFLDLVPVGAGEEQLWLAVRRAAAESVGLTREAIYPEDRLADLWQSDRYVEAPHSPVLTDRSSIGRIQAMTRPSTPTTMIVPMPMTKTNCRRSSRSYASRYCCAIAECHRDIGIGS